jgi:hypothetical protein
LGRERGRGDTHISAGNVFDELGVEVGPLAHLLEERVDHVLEGSVLETALLRPAEGCADGEGDDDVIGVLGEAVFSLLAYTSA